MVVLACQCGGNRRLVGCRGLLVRRRDKALAAHGVVDISGSTPGIGRLITFYAWQLADMLPAVEATDTLRWKEPVDYESADIGGLVLGYKITVVLTLLGVIRLAWRVAHRPDSHTDAREPDPHAAEAEVGQSFGDEPTSAD